MGNFVENVLLYVVMDLLSQIIFSHLFGVAVSPDASSSLCPSFFANYSYRNCCLLSPTQHVQFG